MTSDEKLEKVSKRSDSSVGRAAFHTSAASKSASGSTLRLYHLQAALESLQKALEIELARQALGLGE